MIYQSHLTNILCYTNFKMTEIKNQNGVTEKKARQKIKGTKNLMTVPQLYRNAEYRRLGKVM